MAAAPASKLVLAIFINDDESVGEFAAVRQDGACAAHGIGPFQLAEFAKQAVAAKFRVFTLGGLDAMKRAYQTSRADSAKTAALAALAAAHADVAYDFLVDNGYPLSWDSLFPDAELPAAAADAAAMIATWIGEAEKTGVIARQTMAGKTSHWPLVAFAESRPAFRTVREACATLKQDPPDQSWMSGDAHDIHKETEWLDFKL